MYLKTDIDAMREGRAIAQRLLKSKQEPEDDDLAAIAAALHATDRVKAHLKEREEEKAIRKDLANVLREGPALGSTGRWSAKAAAPALAHKINEGGRKALAPSGSEVAPAGLSELAPIPLARPATSLLAVIPAQVVAQPPTYAFLRQTARDNNAAAVASGALKPTSAYGIQRVEDRLRVIAHLSEPIDKFWVEDADDLRVFIEQEMAYGLDLAVERQVLNGDGIGENNRGILQTSGIQSQAWSTDGAETLRKAVTKLQQQGAATAVAVLNPVDWEALTLLRDTTGQFLATSANATVGNGSGTAPPYAATALASWGVPLVLTNALTPGQAVMLDPDAVRLFTDGQVRTEWNTSVGFTTNEVIARHEGRFGVAVRKPLHVVSVDMSAL